MTEKPAPYDTVSQKIEQVVLQGDLAALSAEERVNYYHAVCNSLGLNPLTRPFGYIKLNNKLTLYAHKDATDQLRKRDGISVYNMEREVVSDVYVVTSYGVTTDGRKDVATGAVFIKGKTGDALANAMMKAETKSKRRLTLSICGLGFLDESEASSIPATDAQAVTVTEDGEIVEPLQPEPPKPANLAPINPTGHNDWWGGLIKELKPFDYGNHHHVINALKSISWDPESMDYAHRDEIKAALITRKAQDQPIVEEKAA